MKTKITVLLFVIANSLSFSQVGIGTTNPKATLDLVASSTSTPNSTDGLLIPRVTAFPTSVTVDQNGMMVFLKTAFGTNQIGLYYYDFPTTTWKWLSSGSNSTVWTNNNVNTRVEIPKLSDGITNRSVGNELVVKDNGNVGIGLAIPTEKLEITGGGIRINKPNGIGFGDIPRDGNVGNDDSAKIYYDVAAFGITTVDGLVIEKTDTNDAIVDGGIMFANKGNDNVRVPSMVIRGTGNVGIGLTAPTQKLDVIGNIKFSGALMPNNSAGTIGQVLVSAGPGVAPIWNSDSVKPIFKTTATGIYLVSSSNYTVSVNVLTANRINLPAASANTGRSFVIIGMNGIATIPFTTSGGSIIDEAFGVAITTLASTNRYVVQSDGTNWVVIGN
jgi:hypothetical protein